MKTRRLASVAVVLSLSTLAWGQVQFLGRVLHPRFPEAADKLPANTGVAEDYFAPGRAGDPAEIMALCNVRCFASVDGPGVEAMAARTWEMAPSGWYRMTGSAGRTTLLFTGPSVFMAPTVFTNVYTRHGQTIDRKVVPRFDYAVLFMGAWDDKAATDYYQTFTSTGTSVTQVGFRLATDGIDGEGPGSQTLLVSVHRQGPGTPDTWEQIGTVVPVPNVDCGGPKNYDWVAAWNSGEVPTEPGKVYAVHIRAEKEGNSFQAFWRPNETKTNDCYRIGSKGQTSWVGRNLCMVVGTDNGGLVTPYNKRVQKEYVEFAGFARKWSQTYVAQGRSLAGALLYMANSGVQPSVARQRAVVRVREGGPDGPVVGVEKIAIGNGIHTGDASWGVYGLAYSPGEVPLKPGKTYAIEFESIENYESLHGYVNIKGMVSDDRPGFNPYKKAAPDTYEKGTAYKNGRDDAGFDLDMQIIEYQHEGKNWDKAVDPQNLLVNGDMEAGELDEENPANSKVKGWRTFSSNPGTAHHFLADPPEKKSKIVRVTAGKDAKAVDGGYVQKIVGLKRLDTYRLSGTVRSSWSLDIEHYCQVGYDPTGQDSDPKAPTIVWETLPGVHSIWVDYNSDPIRPAGDSISVWLRGWAKSTAGTPFKADFDGFSLRRVRTEVPGAAMQVSEQGSAPRDAATAADLKTSLPPAVDAARWAAVNKRVDELIAQLPKREVMTGKGRPSKLGLLYLMGDRESQGMLDLADAGLVPIIKTIAEACNRGHRVVQHNPEAIWIVAGNFKMEPDKHTPQQAAEGSFKMVTHNFKVVPEPWRGRVDFVECTQVMWEPTDAKVGLWYSEFLCELLPRLARLGPRPIVLNCGVGGLPITPEQLAAMAPGLRLARHLGGAWGCHGYTLKYTKDLQVESYHSLRYRRAYDYYREFCPELLGFPMILLEGGVDDVGDENKSGWLARGTLDEYTDWLAWYDSELMKDDQVLGVTLFKIGAPTIWKSFELEPVVPWLREHWQKAYGRKKPGN